MLSLSGWTIKAETVSSGEGQTQATRDIEQITVKTKNQHKQILTGFVTLCSESPGSCVKVRVINGDQIISV